MITTDGEQVIFVEVKKSRDFARAAERLSRRQQDRIYCSAEDFIGQTQRDPMGAYRFDVALVNQSGGVQIIENAFGHA